MSDNVEKGNNKRLFSATEKSQQPQEQMQKQPPRKKNKPSSYHPKSRNMQDAENKKAKQTKNNNHQEKGELDEEQEQEDEEKEEAEGEGKGPWVLREQRHPGSFPLEQILSSSDYQTRHIVQQVPVKKKYILCISYLGTNYQGLQINPDAHTIEQELEKSLFYNGSIIESNYGFLQKIQFTRAARTDRGVHAITQSLAMRLIASREVDLNQGNAREQFIQQVNSFLPNDIEVQGIIKVAKHFNAHSQCTKRIYHYLLPTYVLQSKESIVPILQQLYERQGPIVGAGYEGGYVDPNTSKSLSQESLQSVYETITSSFRLSAEQLQSFRQILQKYEGTKSFHNYTTGKDASEANASRYILSCTCEEPFVNPVTNIEFVKVIFFGQSFLLNQIRKMVGMAIEVMRGTATIDQLTLSFEKENTFEIPMIPALGLYLYDIFFDGYNNKLRKLAEKEQQRAIPKLQSSEQIGKAEEKPSTREVHETSQQEKKDGNDEIVEKEEKKETMKTISRNGTDMEREEICWHENPSIKARLDQFQLNRLFPHIFSLEKESLAFLYYLDYLRVFPHRYPLSSNK